MAVSGSLNGDSGLFERDFALQTGYLTNKSRLVDPFAATIQYNNKNIARATRARSAGY